MTAHPDLESEQAYIDRAYERLDTIRASTQTLRDRVLREGGKGTHQAVYEREVMVNKVLARLDQLDIGDESLCFGRIDKQSGETFHIGRLAISGENQEPLVVDWRVPVAEAFYRATGRHPLGLRRRRHFASEGRKLTGIEDEWFSVGDTGDGELGLAGTGALLRALERARTGFMRDIVATVQKEQDEIIRADLHGVLAVQGGPGTGKTAVALHRAAYLLFTYRRQLGRQGVMVVGPNPLFLRYIDRVLPALGESGVELTTIRGMVPGLRARGSEPAEVARIKGDARMAAVIAKAVADRERPLRQDVVVAFEALELRITTRDTAAAVSAARRAAGTHNRRRRVFESGLFRRLYNQLEPASRRARRAMPDVRSPEELARALKGDPAVDRVLERCWPLLTAQEMVHDLFGAPPLINSAGRGVLTAREAELLQRARSATLDAIKWTPADVALLDEAAVLLGRPRRKTEEEDEEEHPVYGHIVVDEVQDLSPMQLRMVSRRSLSGSMTVVGDIAQATGDWAPDGWGDILRHLPTHRGTSVAQLSINYRTPAEIMDVAARVLNVAAPHLATPRSIRSTGEAPEFVRHPEGAVPAESARRARALAEAIGEGTVAVITPATMTVDLARAFDDEGVAFGDASRHGLEAPVTLVPVTMVKGLEFDAVVVVEPARLVREAPQGLRALFVALTRATKRLTVVHSEPLPESLTPDRRATTPISRH